MKKFDRKGVRFTAYLLGILLLLLLVGTISLPVGDIVVGWFNLDHATWSKVYTGLMTELIVGWFFIYMPYELAKTNYDSNEYGIKENESNIRYYSRIYVWFYYKILRGLAKTAGGVLLLLLVSYLISYLVPSHYFIAYMMDTPLSTQVARLSLGVLIDIIILLVIAGVLVAYMVGYALYLFIKFLWSKA